MKIVAADVKVIDREPTDRLKTSYGPAPDVRPHAIVAIETADGTLGWGEASPLPAFTGETAQSVEFMLKNVFLPAIIGKNALAPGEVHRAMAVLPANTSAKAAIDMALYDLKGKLMGVPVYRLFSGRGGNPFEPASSRCNDQPGFRITRALSIEDIDDTVTNALDRVGKGHRTLKMKVGGDIESNIRRVAAVREAVGDDVRIRVDGNQGFTVPQAIRLIRGLAPLGLEYVEQPVKAWDIRGLAMVREATGMPIAADESLHSIQNATALAQAEAVDFFVIKLIKTGGLFWAEKIAAIAEASGIGCIAVSPFETQIGASAGVHFAAAYGAPDHDQELTVFAAQPDMAKTKTRADNGWLYPSAEPGLGVDEIDELRLGVPLTVQT